MTTTRSHYFYSPTSKREYRATRAVQSGFRSGRYEVATNVDGDSVHIGSIAYHVDSNDNVTYIAMGTGRDIERIRLQTAMVDLTGERVDWIPKTR